MHLIFELISTALLLFSYALIAYILMSWIPGSRETPFGMFLARICEPYLEPFRRLIPPLGMIDISPVVAIFALHFARVNGLNALKNILMGIF